MRWRILAILALGTTLRGESVPIKMEHGYAVVEPVYLNGQGPFHFLLDTGAESTIIESTVASRLGLQPDYRVELVTAAGTHRVPAGRASVGLGTAAADEAEVLWGSLAAGIDGALGQSVLARFNYRIDYQNRRFVWEEPSPAGEKLPLDVSHGRPAVMAQAGGKELRLLLDSGADRLVLFQRVPGVRVEQTGQAATHHGSRAVGLGKVTNLQVGRLGLCEAPVALAEGGTETEPAGLLPAAWFDYVYVNNREGYVILGPPTKRLRSACRTGPHPLQSLLFP